MVSERDRHANEIQHGKYLAKLGAEDTWGWGSPAGQLRAERRGRFVSQIASLSAGKKALEIGCGTGLFTKHFARTGAQILATDISADLIELAKKRAYPSNITFRAKAFEDKSLDGDGPFDAVIGSSVLHHLELQPTLARIMELLKPGGFMAFAEPNLMNPQIAAERSILRPWFKYVSPDETAFLRWKLSKKLDCIGFVNIEIKPFDWLHPATPSAFIGVIAVIGQTLEKLPIIREFSGSLLISARKPSNS